MNINRNNYEEFFLLYVDNELSAAERNAVEVFVQDNADLKEELHILQQTVFKADAVIFDNKSSLLKEDIAALQENLLLYIDGELNAAEKLDTEKLLSGNVNANIELTLLQKTKLQPETIVFADKKILYRKEAARVVGINWRRIAAAAVLLGFGTWATVSYINYKNNGGAIAAAGKKKIVTPAQKQNTVTPVVPAPQNTIAVDDKNTTNIAEVKNAPQKNNQQVGSDKKTVPQQIAPEQKDNNVVQQQPEIKKPSNNLPKPDYNNFNKEERNNNIAQNVPPMNQAIDNRNSGKDVITASSNLNAAENITGYALNTKYTEGDTDNLSPDDQKGKKIKLGGFFRKVKRLVERTTNTKEGDGVKIAGFDIAIK